ncbi:unnamed protein product [Strongylus vulgaris]|uniref:Reverse transcriptase domain-containing protein n=1 Tax=Strongylus vulgaris TaxID=40348 RepID=A0A3P7KAZ7_STRVU|nr:unnamed protein product [Strongylus vulgaris]
MSHTLEIFERVLETRLRAIIELPFNQCGIVKGTGTADAIHSVRIVIEKYREKRRAPCGFPGYGGSFRQDSGRQSKPFRIKTGHQGSVLSPLLFIAVKDAVTEGLKRQPPRAVLYAECGVDGRKQRKT